MIARVRLGAVVVLLAAVTCAPAVVAADPQVPADHMRAVNVVPPGQSGAFNLATFAAVTAGAQDSYGPNFADQLPLYRDWQYKPFQFDRSGTGSHPGGRTDVTVYRDQWGVPEIYAETENAMVYALGYTMAQDRLFQMEAFRHVGTGTLAELIGAAGLPMDEQTRRVSEGRDARLAELAAAPQRIQDEANEFTAGINQSIVEQCGPSGAIVLLPSCPAEFALLGDAPIRPWENDDTIAFGEYAGRNFGEFDVGELTAVRSYHDLVTKLGQPDAEKAFNDLYPLDIPDAPVITAPADGLFPRHTGSAVAHASATSPYANHDAAYLPSAADAAIGAAAIDAREKLIRRLERQLGIPRWGSNAIAVSGSRTADGNPILYSGPQTGWAVPGFFWEVEVHDPVRDARGVTVPTIPLIVIGRNSDSGWSVTSGLDANASTFDEILSDDNSSYSHGGVMVPLDVHQEVIKCNTPPSNAADILSGGLPTLCPFASETIDVYRTVHGPGLADPTEDHHLFTRQTTVDHEFIASLDAWDGMVKVHNAAAFRETLRNNHLSFNFFYVAATGEVAYQHTGRFPIWPSNVDPNLTVPGTGEWDWQGLETYDDQPHVINPTTGYLVNWNNKQAKGWWSPTTLGGQFGPEHQAVDLAHVVGGNTQWTFDGIGQAPRMVAYTDNRARVFVPYLLEALAGTSDAKLQQVRAALAAYDYQRVDNGSGGYGPATTFFDRWFEALNRDVFGAALDADQCGAYLGISCTDPASHWVSIDNLGAPAHKFDSAAESALLRAFRGATGGLQNEFDVFHGGTWQAAAQQAADEASTYLTSTQGADPAAWSEPMEMVTWPAQGAGSAEAYGPLQNRGSYGQVVEPFAVTPAASGPTMLPNSAVGPGGMLVAFSAALLLLLLVAARPSQKLR
ncbi:MAG: penicillin amidase [Chloroflexota bacterium]|nr:penicillin amidase [Chloroflexota bacterium]